MVITLLLSTTLAAEPADWTRWRGPDRTGISPETGWKDDGSLLWQAQVGLGYSAVAVQDGSVFTHGFLEAVGKDRLVCLDADTGKEVWNFSYKATKRDNMHSGGTLTTPVVDDERLFLLSREGRLHCLDSENGDKIWSRLLTEEFEVELGPFGFCSSPVVVDDLVFLNVGKSLALERDSGETVWETQDYGVSYGTPAPFEAQEYQGLAVFNGVGLVILDQDTGDELHRHDWTSRYNVNSATPIVLGSQVFISTGYDPKGCALLDFSGPEIAVVWESKVISSKMNGCVHLDGHLYGFDDKVLKCVDLEGKEKWHERGLGLGTVSASDGRLIVMSEDGELIIASATPEGFQPRSRERVLDSGKCWTYPVLSGGRIYCRSSLGQLVCRDHRPSRER